MSDPPDDQVPTDPWGNPLPPEQWPRPAPPPPVPPAHQPDPNATQPGWAQPGWGAPEAGPYQPPAGMYPPQQTWTPQGYAPWGGPQKTEGMAIGALVCGIIGLLCGLIGCVGVVVGPIAIVLGAVARRRVRESQGLTKGEGLALAGLVLGVIGTLASIGWIIAIFTVPELRDRLEELTSTTTTEP